LLYGRDTASGPHDNAAAIKVKQASKKTHGPSIPQLVLLVAAVMTLNLMKVVLFKSFFL
jgi:hypothetical protein